MSSFLLHSQIIALMLIEGHECIMKSKPKIFSGALIAAELEIFENQQGDQNR